LGNLGNYVNIIADGDPAILVQSGFLSYGTDHTPDTTPPGAPQNLVVRQGDLSGTLVARYQPDRQHSINDVQTNTGDPNTESDWKPAGMFSGGKATLSGSIRPLPPPHSSGQVYVAPLPAGSIHARHSHLGAGAHRRSQRRQGRLERPRPDSSRLIPQPNERRPGPNQIFHNRFLSPRHGRCT